MIQTLYEKLIESLPTNKERGVATAMLGKDTEFEAIYMITCGDDDAMWRGYLVFKDQRFSPSEDIDGLPKGLLQLQYDVPSAGNGVLAHQWAENYWKTLCGMFKGLMTGVRPSDYTDDDVDITVLTTRLRLFESFVCKVSNMHPDGNPRYIIEEAKQFTKEHGG